jgi:hypothetical protein
VVADVALFLAVRVGGAVPAHAAILDGPRVDQLAVAHSRGERPVDRACRNPCHKTSTLADACHAQN